MTELSFLLELLLNHKLQKPTKDLIQARIKEVESRPVPSYPQMAIPGNVISTQATQSQPVRTVDSRGVQQSPSMMRAIAEMEAVKNGVDLPPQQTINREPSPEVVANAMAPQAPQHQPVVASPAAAQALLDRQRLIERGISQNGGNFEKGAPGAVKLGQPKT